MATVENSYNEKISLKISFVGTQFPLNFLCGNAVPMRSRPTTPLCRGFLLRLPHIGGLFRRLKAFLPRFSLCGGLSATFFSLWGDFFHYLKALLLRFSPFGGPFHRLKVIHSLCWDTYVKSWCKTTLQLICMCLFINR